ncbi:LysR family transcriptional regulator [Trinickia dabaoshanensis]|uniref:LysR family transcriptional regulator n=1 Tax=Trinickia dabaoshanensis TaxID=564714 RepID=A0A2N7VCZ4_9BURK|nr:LysR family transcriptional regulator [Trinickia dabaoshanensis]PMS15026.1 LysR family transcriptional regulator [Trinickia dabaoshanensis]
MADLRDVNLNRLVVFAAVVEAGSLSAAAERLGLAKTMVSAHIQRLEAEVGVTLIVRTTRRSSLTEAGRTLYEASRECVRTATDALESISASSGRLRGVVRVASPVDYGELVVAPALAALRRAHPELGVELICGEGYVDLVAERIDVAVRLGNLKDSSYRSARLGQYMRWLVASPAFLDGRQAPRSPSELGEWPFVGLSTLAHPDTLSLRHEDGRRETVRCRRAFIANTASAGRAATLAGAGYGLMTDFSIGEDLAAGRLVRLLPQWAAEPAAIQAVFPSSRQPSAKVAAVIDALRTYLARADQARVSARR